MKNIFYKKNILIYGLASSGKSAKECLEELGANVFIFDDNLKSNKRMINETFIKNLDFLVLSPGVSIFNEWVKVAKLFGVKILSEMELGYLLTKKANHIALTGSNGKSTTVSLINSIFKYAGKECELVGNIGRPITSVINEYNSLKDSANKKNIFFIEECSSFQLESVDKYAPNTAIILNITPNHLDRHHYLEEYISAKKNIIKNLSTSANVILNADDELVMDFKKDCKNKTYFFSEKKVVNGVYLLDDNIIFSTKKNKTDIVANLSQIHLIGAHNIPNVLAAVLVAKLHDIKNKIIVMALEKFTGLSHRFEYVGKICGIDVINDSKSTTFEATSSAIKSLSMKNITLILGGKDKGVSATNFLKNLPDSVKRIILTGEIREQLLEESDRCNIGEVYAEKDLKDVIDLAFEISAKDEVILFSPAYSSLDSYKSFEERGDHFKKLIAIKAGKYEE